MHDPAMLSGLQSLARFPAKFVQGRERDGRDPNAYHPLYCHMHDVAAVAGKIWDDVLAPGGRAYLSHAMELDEQAARTWVTFLAGLHDLGKAAPAFLTHARQHPAVVSLAGDFSPIQPGVQPADAPHGVVTAIALHHLLEGIGVARSVAGRMADTAGGHHGFFPSAQEQSALGPSAYGKAQAWHDARAALFAQFARDLGIEQLNPPLKFENGAALFVAGLISVADWIGSARDAFDYLSEDGTVPHPEALADYPARATKLASAAVARLQWQWQQPTAAPTLQALFGLDEPRGLQQAAAALATTLGANAGQPAIVLLEAPTGEGKTEAALLLADAFARTGSRGFYLALPTQATSNQMYSRVRKFLARAYEDAPGPVRLQLLHGHASLNAEFEAMLADLGASPAAAPLSPEAVFDGEGTGDVRAADWFSYRKRGLLAPFGVGTVDQALLAALQTRHVFVRLFGLAGKTVIVDEVHAYDTYMSTLMERLLEWLAALGSPVVLLSATLPKARTRALISAYAKGAGGDPGETELAPYPRLSSWAATAGGVSQPLETSAAGRRVLAWDWCDGMGPGNEQALAAWVTAQVSGAGGGCAAIVCNTVRRAQRVYRTLKTHVETLAPEARPELSLFHARFPFEQRDRIEKQTLLRFGKPEATVAVDGEERPVLRPPRAILVATQVVEQSLDLDFDVMVTDFAPVDLLLQRAGRLQRHQRQRPAGLEVPVLHVVAPPAEGDVPTFDKGDCAVYARHVLLRTWLALQARGGQSIAIPGDIETLIEAVYGEGACPPGASVGLRQLWADTERQHAEDQAAENRQAEERYIRAAAECDSLEDLVEHPQEEDNEEIHRAFQAVTRLAKDSIGIVCLDTGEDGTTRLDGAQVDLTKRPGRELTKRLVGRSLTLSDRRVVRALRESPVPAGWARSPLLRHFRAVCFDAAGYCPEHPRLQLDAEVGMMVGEGDTSAENGAAP